MERTIIALSMIVLVYGEFACYELSRYHVKFLSAEIGVRLEVLDRGGSGRTIVVPFAVEVVSGAGEFRVPRFPIQGHIAKLEWQAAIKFRQWSRRLTRSTIHSLLRILPAPAAAVSAVLRFVQDSRIASYSAAAAQIVERAWNFAKFLP